MGILASGKKKFFVLLGVTYILICIFIIFAFAGGVSRSVFGTIRNEDGSTPANGAIAFTAYIQARSTDTQTQLSPGPPASGYSTGTLFFNLGNFVNPWTAGETLVINITNSVNSQKKTITQVLSTGSAAINLGTVSLVAKQPVSIAISGPASAAVGGSGQFTATCTYDDNSTGDVTASVNWNVLTPSPAGAGAFDQAVFGRLNALKAGTLSVQATLGLINSPTSNVTITAFAGTVAVAPNPASIIANGATSTITATVAVGANPAVDGVPVAFAVASGGGTITPSAVTAGGTATATYTSPTTAGTANVTATVGTVSNNANIALTHGPAAKIELTANPPLISSTIISESTLTARILDANNNLVKTGAGSILTVDFAATLTTFGDIRAGFTAVPAVGGEATSYAQSKGDSTTGTIPCRASSGALTAGTVDVSVAPKILQSIAITLAPAAGNNVSTFTPKVGQSVQLIAVGTFRDAAPPNAITQDVITTQVDWTASNAKGTVGLKTGLYVAAKGVASVGAVDVTATLGAISKTVTMTNQTPDAVTIDTTKVSATSTLGGTINFGAAGVVVGGTGDGFTYSILSGPAGGAIDPNTGLFTAGNNAGAHVVQAYDVTSGATATFTVKVPFTIKTTPDNTTSWNFKTGDAKAFIVSGTSAATVYTWDIMDSLTATTPVTTPSDYGTWTTPTPADGTNTFTATATASKTFYVRVSVEGIQNLIDNGLDKLTVGPFNIIPMAAYTVNVKDAAGALGGATVTVNYAAVPDTTTIGKYIFTLPDTGGTYAYTVTLANYISQSVSSALKTFDVTLQTVDAAKAISGTVQDTTGTALVGATVTAYIPTALATQYVATTIAGGAYTINLPTGAAATGWTLVAAMTNYEAVTQTGIAAGATANFTGAAPPAGFGLPSVVGPAPDAGAGGGTQTEIANGQTTTVQVPAGGLTTDGFIIITQTAKTAPTSGFTSASPTYVYEVKVTSDAAGTTPLPAADIKRIVITLPLDLSIVKPGDMERGVFTIYQAPGTGVVGLTNLQSGNVETVPTSNIISTDYLGNGTVGSVTFWVSHLSFFGIGASSGGGAAGGGTILTDTNSDSRCFIATAAFGSPFQKYVEMLRKFRDVYLLSNEFGRKFVNMYYNYSPKIASFIADHDVLRAAVRVALMPAIVVSYAMLQFGAGWCLLALAVMISSMMLAVAIVRRRRSNMA